MNNRMRYYKLSIKTIKNELTLEVQTAKLTQPLQDALNKVKTMDELDALKNSDFYKETMAKYQSLLKGRIEYHEQQMSQLTPLKGSLTTLELGIESKLRKMLLADYSTLSEPLKQRQL